MQSRRSVKNGSPCTVHLHTDNKSLGVRGKAAIIIGKNDETKGYRVYLPKERIVVVTKHVQNIETRTNQQECKPLEVLQDVEGQEESEVNYGDRPSMGRSTKWTRDRHLTRSLR